MSSLTFMLVHRETDDKETDKETDDKETDKETDKEIDKETDRDRQTKRRKLYEPAEYVFPDIVLAILL